MPDMFAGYDWQRLLRVVLISAVLFGAFLLLRPYGLGWVVIPGGLGVAIVIILLALWQNKRAHKKLERLHRELEELRDSQEKRP